MFVQLEELKLINQTGFVRTLVCIIVESTAFPDSQSSWPQLKEGKRVYEYFHFFPCLDTNPSLRLKLTILHLQHNLINCSGQLDLDQCNHVAWLWLSVELNGICQLF